MSGVTAAKTSSALDRRALGWIDALSLRFGRPAALPPHLATGLRGEEEAFFFLKERGYVVVARRWKTPKVAGDVDLIAWDGDTLCFIEVKTRTHRNNVPAEFAVDQQKQKTLRSMASIFRKHLPQATRRQTLLRFDVVSVYLVDQVADTPPQIEHFPGAF